jgi:hypothetical protein
MRGERQIREKADEPHEQRGEQMADADREALFSGHQRQDRLHWHPGVLQARAHDAAADR